MNSSPHLLGPHITDIRETRYLPLLQSLIRLVVAAILDSRTVVVPAMVEDERWVLSNINLINANIALDHNLRKTCQFRAPQLSENLGRPAQLSLGEHLPY